MGNRGHCLDGFDGGGRVCVGFERLWDEVLEVGVACPRDRPGLKGRLLLRVRQLGCELEGRDPWPFREAVRM